MPRVAPLGSSWFALCPENVQEQVCPVSKDSPGHWGGQEELKESDAMGGRLGIQDEVTGRDSEGQATRANPVEAAQRREGR